MSSCFWWTSCRVRPFTILWSRRVYSRRSSWSNGEKAANRRGSSRFSADTTLEGSKTIQSTSNSLLFDSLSVHVLAVASTIIGLTQVTLNFALIVSAHSTWHYACSFARQRIALFLAQILGCYCCEWKQSMRSWNPFWLTLKFICEISQFNSSQCVLVVLLAWTIALIDY